MGSTIKIALSKALRVVNGRREFGSWISNNNGNQLKQQTGATETMYPSPTDLTHMRWLLPADARDVHSDSPACVGSSAYSQAATTCNFAKNIDLSLTPNSAWHKHPKSLWQNFDAIESRYLNAEVDDRIGIGGGDQPGMCRCVSELSFLITLHLTGGGLSRKHIHIYTERFAYMRCMSWSHVLRGSRSQPGLCVPLEPANRRWFWFCSIRACWQTKLHGCMNTCSLNAGLPLWKSPAAPPYGRDLSYCCCHAHGF